MEHIAACDIFGLVLVTLAGQIASAQNCSTGNDSWLVTASASYNTTIASPNYPLGYSDNMECTWLVEIENKLNFAYGGYVIKVLFNDFELQQDDALSLTRCPFDNLTFYHGYLESTLFLGSFCGTVHPEVIYSTGNNLSIRFHTDNKMTFRGFNISVSVVEAEEAAGICRYPYYNYIDMEKVFGKYSGTIFSPSYPVPYPDDAFCVWRLVAPRDREVKLKFVDFELRGSSMNDVNDNCVENYTNMDHVEIGDGFRPFHGGISCGNQTTSEVYSTGGIMYVEFTAIPVGVRGKRGFKAHFEAVDLSVFDEELCLPRNINNLNLKLTGSHGTLQSPLEYHIPGIKCEWLITVPEEKVVELSFDRFKLPPKHPSLECFYNSLQVYDGKDDESLGIYCDDVVPEPLRSSGRYMRVRFTSDTEYQTQYPGFKATFTAVDKRKTLAIILGTVCGVIFLVIVVVCIRFCRANRKRAHNTEASDGVPMSTITTSASHTTQPGRAHDLLLSAGNLDPDPHPPDSTSPAVSSPGEESVPMYPPPGELYSWQQSNNSA